MAQQGREPNLFELTDGEDVQITYNATHFIDQPTRPQLTYQDAERNLTFNRDAIRTQQSELGTLVSVTLELTVDAGATVLTVLLPPINLAEAEDQPFETFGIVTRSYGMLPRMGARLTYEDVVELDGVARAMPIL